MLTDKSDKPLIGKVISTGPGYTTADNGLQPLDISDHAYVIYPNGFGTKVIYDGEECILIQSTNCLLTFTSASGVPEIDDVKAVEDKILIKRHKYSEKSDGGLIMNAKTLESSTGTIISLGPGSINPVTKQIEKIEGIGEGDNVKFKDYAGMLVTVEGKEYVVVKGSEILAKF